VDQEIRFCTAADGVHIAYSRVGAGPPLVKAANYLTHLERDWRGPVWRPWLRELSRRWRLIRYDERGCGLSDRNVDDFSIDAWVKDLEAVADANGLEEFPLLGISQGASVCVAYAARHPERVTHLVLYGGYARGRLKRSASPDDRLQAETMINAMRVGWGQDNPAFRQLFSTMLMPEGTEAQIDSLNELARTSADPATAARMERAFYHIDVCEEARAIRTPTLVLHVKGDATVPFEEGRHLAGLIPGARMVPLEGRNHVLREDEPAFSRFVDEIASFLGRPGLSHGDGPVEALTRRELQILELIARGDGNDEIARRLTVTEKTVRNYVHRIYRKLDVETRAQAIVMAREAGLGLS
jgi:pimeloyl-ACP methyl ester carboxylesterase